MGQFNHLTLEGRDETMLVRRDGKSLGEIALRTGRDESTISRGRDRNSFNCGSGRLYRASTAQRRYEKRRRACVCGRLLNDPERAALVTGMIAE